MILELINDCDGSWKNRFRDVTCFCNSMLTICSHWKGNVTRVIVIVSVPKNRLVVVASRWFYWWPQEVPTWYSFPSPAVPVAPDPDFDLATSRHGVKPQVWVSKANLEGSCWSDQAVEMFGDKSTITRKVGPYMDTENNSGQNRGEIIDIYRYSKPLCWNAGTRISAKSVSIEQPGRLRNDEKWEKSERQARTWVDMRSKERRRKNWNKTTREQAKRRGGA